MMTRLQKEKVAAAAAANEAWGTQESPAPSAQQPVNPLAVNLPSGSVLSSHRSQGGLSQRSQDRLAEAEKKAVEELGRLKLQVLEEVVSKKLEIEKNRILENSNSSHKSSEPGSLRPCLQDQIDGWFASQPLDLPPPPPPSVESRQNFVPPSQPPFQQYYLPPGQTPYQQYCLPPGQPTYQQNYMPSAEHYQHNHPTACHQVQGPLPQFTGKIEDWLLFKKSFQESSQRYSNTDNVSRLTLALKNEAKEAVSALLLSCTDPDKIMSALELRFGHPGKIIKSQINIIKNLPQSGTDPEEFAIFVSKINNSITTLTTLKSTEGLNNREVYEEVLKKLSPQMQAKWVDYAGNSPQPSGESLLEQLARFLTRQAELGLQFLPQADPPASNAAPAPTPTSTPLSVNLVNMKPVLKCAYCEKEHSIAKCEKFLELSVDSRWEWVKKNRKCFRCLQFNHNAKNCKISKYLHRLLRKPKEIPKESNNKVNETQGIITNITLGKSCTLLKVVPCCVQGPLGQVSTYAFLDEGASISLMDSDLAKQIGADGPSGELSLQGVGSMRTSSLLSKDIEVHLKSQSDDVHKVRFRTIDKLNLCSQSMSKDSLIKYKHVNEMQDKIAWYETAKPLLLIGQDNWQLIVSREIKCGSNNEPVLSKTLLGWILHGYSDKVINKVFHVNLQCTHDEELNSMVKRSFDLENLGIMPKERVDPAVERAKLLMESTTRRLEKNWETGLLWKEEDVTLPDNSAMAMKRFLNLEEKLKKDSCLAEAYTAQVNRLLKEGYAKPVSDCPPDGKFWLLPHFAVVKPGKVRLVFDAAAKTKGVSLNDKLLTGPDLLKSLLGVLFKFRQSTIAVAADIKDMFLRIKIRKEDQNFQRFYWREVGDDNPPKTYAMTSMLFGAACSPSSAIFVKDRNASTFEEELSMQEAVHAIIHKHYMDNYLDSFTTKEKAIKVAAQVIKIHEHGDFEIRCWTSNSTDVIQSIPEGKRAAGHVELAPDAAAKEKTLGMIWFPATDTLGFNISMGRVHADIATGKERPTKRQMLALIMSVYDPIGLLSPLTIRGKILLQEAWRSGVGWDDKLQDAEFDKWSKWLDSLQCLQKLQVPRCYINKENNNTGIELHTFCDASQMAYAACCYLRYEYSDGDVKITLAAAKARVTPLKPKSIPRLELQAALLGARLAHTVITEHELPIKEAFYWTDSGTVMAWLRSDPRNYKAFVGHRLAAIEEYTSVGQWRWVPTNFNSADVATRDLKPLDLSPTSTWFSGPQFLTKNKDDWPVETSLPSVENTCNEERKHNEERIHVIREKEYSLPDVSRFSSWLSLIRCTAYILLFIMKIQKKEKVCKLTVDLLNKAEKMWIKKCQMDSYPEDLHRLENKEELPPDSKLLQLTPMLDDEGIMRVRGRIDATPGLSEDQKRPIILSGSHLYTKLLVRRYHTRYNHGSTETVVNELRQRYWVTNLRSTVRSVAHSCQHCKIQKAKTAAPPMGDLPPYRLDHHKRPFTHTGLDYFGPLEVAIGRRREKRYGALFTCMVTRAVHMELAASLTTDSVIMAIRRMIARRGNPTDIYSDNGSNFHGAETELKKALKEMNQDKVHEDLMNRGIRWHFIPASAPHMGGAWERMVQAIKKSLYATLKERAPKEEVLLTLMLEAENVVNSRPLTHVSVDHRDAESLTPNHFLIGSSSGSPVPGSFDDKDLLRRKQWRVSQRLSDMFWSRFVKEYIPTLQRRPIVTKPQENVAVNDLVIVGDGTLPRNVWPRGVVVRTFPGKDGRVRVVDVKTTGGVLRRPVHKLLILPVKDDSASVSGTPGNPPVGDVGRASSA